MRVSDLKPCPWCGSDDVAVSDGVYPHVYCRTCDSEGPYRDCCDDATQAWNTRTLETENAALKERVGEFQQIVRITPAFDKRHSDPNKNYGIGACRIWFMLKGPIGIVQFQIGTDWYPPHVQREHRDWQHNHDSEFDKIKPEGWDVGYHSPKPMYEDQHQMECDLLPGGKCYYDGSGLRAGDWISEFLSGGTDWLWPRLEEEYRRVFEAQDKDDG